MNKIYYSSKTILSLGFGFVGLIVAGLTITWAVNVIETKENLHRILDEHQQSDLIAKMRDATRQRAISLHRMAIMEDVFDRDQEYIEFQSAAGDFIKEKEELFEHGGGEKQRIWDAARPLVQDGQIVQQKVAELLLDEQFNAANKLLLEEVMPIQNQVNEILSEISEVQKQIAVSEFNAAVGRNEKFYVLAIALGGGAVLLTLLTAFIVIRRTSQVEASLVDARVAAQTATAMKSQFLANMSHEIRTPLSAIIGFAESIVEDDLDEKDRDHSANSILRNGRHLLHLINDILDISKIEAGQLIIEKLAVSPVQLLMELDSLIGNQIRDKGLEFLIKYNFPLPSEISTDPVRLKQVLMNLCSNAAKFTSMGSVSINVKFLHLQNKIVFTVIDTGVGMTQQEQKNLFKPFSQADNSTTRKYGGTGLGLYISRQLMRLLGGDIYCQSRKDKGSSFTVEINEACGKDTPMIYTIANNSVRQVKMEQFSMPRLEGQILVVEDSKDNQEIISMYIRNAGADVTVVEDGKKAVETALAKTYDLIFMDMQMPVMGGIEAVRLLRQAGNRTTIVMLTANAMKVERDNCMAAGANDFLTKPIDKRKFYQLLEKYLKQGKQPSLAATVTNLIDELSSGKAVFNENLSQYIDDLTGGLLKKDWDALQSVLHKLKGIGGSVGYPGITEKCRQIENLYKQTGIIGVTKSVSNLISYCREIREQQLQITAIERVGT